MQVTLDHRVRLREGVLVTATGDEMVALSMADEKYYGLDDMGRAVWEVAVEADSLTAACDDLERRYEVGRPELERDVLELIQQLVDHDLLDVS